MVAKRKFGRRFASPDLVGQGRDPEGRTDDVLHTFFEAVYRPLRLRGGSPRTAKIYTGLIKRFSEYLGRPARLADFDDLTVAGFLEHRRAKGLSPFTVERERSGLVALWGLAARRGLVSQWPEVPPAKLPRRAPEAWTVPQMHQLFSTARNAPGWVNGVPANEFWAALLAVLWETGERISAVLAATKADYHRPTVLIRGESRKGGIADRVYTLSPATCHRLELAMDHRQPTIFFWPGCHSALWGAWKRLVQRAGLPAGRGSGFHMVRRSAASHLAAHGGDATEFLGHRSPELARKWYLDPRITRAGKPSPADVLPRID